MTTYFLKTSQTDVQLVNDKDEIISNDVDHVWNAIPLLAIILDQNILKQLKTGQQRRINRRFDELITGKGHKNYYPINLQNCQSMPGNEDWFEELLKSGQIVFLTKESFDTLLSDVKETDLNKFKAFIVFYDIENNQVYQASSDKTFQDINYSFDDTTDITNAIDQYSQSCVELKKAQELKDSDSQESDSQDIVNNNESEKDSTIQTVEENNAQEYNNNDADSNTNNQEVVQQPQVAQPVIEQPQIQQQPVEQPIDPPLQNASSQPIYDPGSRQFVSIATPSVNQGINAPISNQQQFINEKQINVDSELQNLQNELWGKCVDAFVPETIPTLSDADLTDKNSPEISAINKISHDTINSDIQNCNKRVHLLTKSTVDGLFNELNKKLSKKYSDIQKLSKLDATGLTDEPDNKYQSKYLELVESKQSAMDNIDDKVSEFEKDAQSQYESSREKYAQSAYDRAIKEFDSEHSNELSQNIENYRVGLKNKIEHAFTKDAQKVQAEALQFQTHSLDTLVSDVFNSHPNLEEEKNKFAKKTNDIVREAESRINKKIEENDKQIKELLAQQMQSRIQMQKNQSLSTSEQSNVKDNNSKETNKSKEDTLSQLDTVLSVANKLNGINNSNQSNKSEKNNDTGDNVNNFPQRQKYAYQGILIAAVAVIAFLIGGWGKANTNATASQPTNNTNMHSVTELTTDQMKPGQKVTVRQKGVLKTAEVETVSKHSVIIKLSDGKEYVIDKK